MSTLHTFWDAIIPYRTESVHFLGLMNSATRFGALGGLGSKGLGLRV